VTQAVIRPAQPQSIGEVLDTSFRLYRASIGKVWGLGLLIVLASAPAPVYMFVKGGTLTPTGADPMAAMAVFKDTGYWMAYLIGFVLTQCAMGALYLKQNAIGIGEALTTGQALQQALSRVVTLVIMTLLFFVAITLGLVLLVIPGFILMVSLMPTYSVALLEHRGPVASLRESHSLVWGHWWRTSAILTVGFIIVIVLYVAIGFVMGLVVPFMVSPGNSALFGLISTVLVFVGVYILVMPFSIAMLLAIYWDLKLRKHGGDLAARVGALGTA
jgi:hypothetical protein